MKNRIGIVWKEWFSSTQLIEIGHWTLRPKKVSLSLNSLDVTFPPCPVSFVSIMNVGSLSQGSFCGASNHDLWLSSKHHSLGKFKFMGLFFM